MFGFAFAMVPLYRVFCEVTGINRDEAQVLAINTQVDTSRLVLVQLLANVEMPPSGACTRPAAAIPAHPGELIQVDFELENLADRAVSGLAVASYAPAAARAISARSNVSASASSIWRPGTARLPVMFVLDRQIPPDLGVVTAVLPFFRQVKT
jgi:cytochrome c oxidase assembly protein subunit 11